MEKVNQTFFLSHGTPRLSIDDSLEARDFFKSWSHKVFQHKPKSILVISAHWDTEFPSVNTVLRNTTIHDFNGFPEPMYKVSISLFRFLSYANPNFCLTDNLRACPKP